MSGQSDTGAALGPFADLLGLLAYGSLSACMRVAADADRAPTLTAKAALAAIAVADYRHYETLVDRLTRAGLDPEAAMGPFVAPIDAFHARTSPDDWLEGLVKAYVGEGIALDFAAELADRVDPSVREAISQVIEASRQDFVIGAVQQAVTVDPRVRGRLALWSRRVVGEALSQAQRVAADRRDLVGLVLGSPADADGRAPGAGADLVEIGAMFTRITGGHARRMQLLGLV